MADQDDKQDGKPRQGGQGENGDKKDADGDKEKQDQQKKEQAEEEEKKKPKAKWPWVVAAFIVLAFIVVVLVIVLVPATSVWTDDAYVTAHYAIIAPRVSGQIAKVDVDDNQTVHAGQVLATLDDRDYRTTLANDEAMLARDEAQAQEDAAQIARLPAQIAQAQSQVAANQAQLDFARQNDRRYHNLASTGAGTFQQRQQADMSLRQAQASVAGAGANVEATRRQLAILQAQLAAAQQTVRSDQTLVEQARLNLSYTRVTAPMDGMVGERSAQSGNYVAPGAALMSVVPLDRVYIVANYRELALRHVLPGQRVRIHVDAYDFMLDGVVDSVPPASGAAFAPIQPNNATGNFTKIVQRLPVKILVAPGQREALLLRLGMSVETTIDTGTENVRRDQQDAPARVTSR